MDGQDEIYIYICIPIYMESTTPFRLPWKKMTGYVLSECGRRILFAVSIAN